MVADTETQQGAGEKAGPLDPGRQNSQTQDRQTQDQTNEANRHQTEGTNDAPSPMPQAEGAAKTEPSGYRGNNPSTAGPGNTHVSSATPENVQKQLDPSAPGQTGTTPGSNAK